MVRVEINPELLSWACERAKLDTADVTACIPQFSAWLRGERHPTLKQLEGFAKRVRAPIGYFFLHSPPEEKLPIPDFRTVRNQHLDRPSPDLLDTIYLCQQRQEWYRDYARASGDSELPFVGFAAVSDDVVSVAREIREGLGFNLDARRSMRTWQEARRSLIKQVDDFGIMVMVSSVVGSNNHRKLDFEEFRGFSLSDKLAPLIFINGSDTQSAQMFTLAHELAHIWLGETALSDAEPVNVSLDQSELWCNQVAAEILVPLASFRQEFRVSNDLGHEVTRLARIYKVSTLVILRRIHDAGHLSERKLWRVYHDELRRLQSLPKRGGGGDFYFTHPMKISRRFATAAILSVLEGRASYTESFRLLGIKKMRTFRGLAKELGVLW